MKIVDAGQYVSLEGLDAGQMRCRITVRTDDGRQVSIPTSEDTVNKIIELMAGVVPQQSVETPQAVQPVFTNLEQVSYFGDSDARLGAVSEEPSQEEHPAPGLGQARLNAPSIPTPVRARTVAKDEAGYPIVQRSADDQPQNEIFDEEDPGEQI